MSLNAAIVIISDSRTDGSRAEETTDLLVERFLAANFKVLSKDLIPDEPEIISQLLIDLSTDTQPKLTVTSGGTGLGPRDHTPEATRKVLERETPGISEVLRSETAALNSYSWLSRGVSGLRSNNLIVNLPGNPQGANQCLDVLLKLAPHALKMIRGDSHGQHDRA